MLLSIAVLLVAALVIAGRFVSRDQGVISKRVIVAALLLPALAMAAMAFLGRSADRERIDVQFVGYRIPMSRVLPCGTPGKNIAGGGGVWIGGGRRWPDDKRPDVISLPGYRGNLAEVCTDPKSSELMIRQIRPGESFYQLPSGKWGLQKTTDIDTQRLVLRGAADDVERGCIAYKGASIPVASIVAFAERERETAVRAAPSRGVREGMLKRFRGWPADGDVACVDLAGGAPGKCADDLLITAAPLFVWPTKGKIKGGWDLIAPEGAAWGECSGAHAIGTDQTTKLEAPYVSESTRWSTWKRTASKVTVRMITRRTVGGVADQSVPISTAAFEPLPLRLGTRYELGFARLGKDDLIVIHEDPSVQLRMTDLYGGPPLEVKEGDFDLTFDVPPGEELLVVDLSSRSDHLAPKTIFEGVQARITIPQEGDDFSIVAQGQPSRKRKFNEVFALDVSRDPKAVRPMLLIRRVGAPVMTFVLPLLAALLTIAAAMLDRSAEPMLPSRWLLAPVLLALLELRFAMSTRWLLNEFSSAEALRNWIVNGGYLLLGPPFVMFAAALLRRATGSATRTSAAVDLYKLPSSATTATPSAPPSCSRYSPG